MNNTKAGIGTANMALPLEHTIGAAFLAFAGSRINLGITCICHDFYCLTHLPAAG